jgi:hypothetical protein
MDKLREAFGKAIALNIDAELWWLSLEEHYKTYVCNEFKTLIINARPRWMPRKLWEYLHKGVIR